MPRERTFVPNHGAPCGVLAFGALVLTQAPGSHGWQPWPNARRSEVLQDFNDSGSNDSFGQLMSSLAAPEIDDATLVAGVIAGNEQAFTKLYRRHARYVAGVVYRLLGSDSELDDVVQETFCDALRAIEGLREPAGFRPWLARIAVRRVHKRLAKRRRWSWLKEGVSHVMPRVSDPADRQRVETLYAALDAMSPDIRIPWVLHVVEGELLEDVATMCEVSLATVKRRIAAAAELVERSGRK
jgi:RNA polymerase sigma-70 factor (ECF subfamily)